METSTKSSKKKQFNKNTSLTSVESLKTPKIRRKSLGTVLPTPNWNIESTTLNRRKSIAAVEVPKSAKKNKLLDKPLKDKLIFTETKVEDQKSKGSVENSFTKTPKKSNKRRQSVVESETPQKIKKENQIALAQPKENLKSNSDKKSKKELRKEQKLISHNQDNANIKAIIINLEKQYNIISDNVENAVKGVITLASNNPHLQNQLFNDEIPLFLQINSIKIPNTKGPVKQLFRVPLQHSALPADVDICLIVPDVKGINNKEHEKHLDHYENLLQSKDVTGIKKIMTFHEFRTEYETFELKHRLADLYDVFLVDGKISGKVVKKCGSIFYKKRKVPIAVKLHVTQLKTHIGQAIKKSFFHVNVKSDSHCVQIGHSKMDTNDLVENVYSVVEFLNKKFPGKMDNIRSLNVYAHRGSSIPVYFSLKNPNEVKVPTLSIKKPKAYKSASGELTTQYNANVEVRPSGQIIVRRSRAPIEIEPDQENVDDVITDAEILRENKKNDQVDQQNAHQGKKGTKKRNLSKSDEKQTKEVPTKKQKIKNVSVKKESDNSPGKNKVNQSHNKKSKNGRKTNKKSPKTFKTKPGQKANNSTETNWKSPKTFKTRPGQKANNGTETNWKSPKTFKTRPGQKSKFNKAGKNNNKNHKK